MSLPTLNEMANDLGLGSVDHPSATLPVLVRTIDGNLHEKTALGARMIEGVGTAIVLDVKPYEPPPVTLTLADVERVLSRFSEHVDPDQARTFLDALRTEATAG